MEIMFRIHGELFHVPRGHYMDVSENSDTPKSSISIGFFHYKPSILGYPYSWKHPYMTPPQAVAHLLHATHHLCSTIWDFEHLDNKLCTWNINMAAKEHPAKTYPRNCVHFLPIASTYGIFTYIYMFFYHSNVPNVVKYTSPMMLWVQFQQVSCCVLYTCFWKMLHGNSEVDVANFRLSIYNPTIEKKTFETHGTSMKYLP